MTLVIILIFLSTLAKKIETGGASTGRYSSTGKITGTGIHNTRLQSIHPVVSPWSISVQNWPLTTDHSRHLLIKWPLNTDRLTSKKCMIQYGDHVHEHENIRVRVRVRVQNPWSTQQKQSERTWLNLKWRVVKFEFMWLLWPWPNSLAAACLQNFT